MGALEYDGAWAGGSAGMGGIYCVEELEKSEKPRSPREYDRCCSSG